MKNKFYVLLLLCFTGILPAKSQIPNYVPQNGLVGWWPFNGNANDESGNGNNGIVNGAILTSDRFGFTNSSYEFDGVNDIISSQLITSLQGDWSISFWYKSTNSSGNFQGQNVIGLGSDIYGWGGAGFQIAGQILPGQCPTFNYLNQMYLIDASQECGGNFLDGGFYNNGNWYNVIIIKNNSNYDLIINDTLISSNALLDIDIDQLIFGNRDISFQYFNGQIDDIGVWNRALTQQEITNLYNGSTPPPCNPLPGNLMTGLVGYWPFCGNANDESGNGNNGTVNGASLTSDRFGNTNSAYEFDGIDDHIIVQDNQIFSVLGNASYTASAYVKFNSMPASAQNILGQGDGDGQYENKFFRLYGQNSQFSGHIRGNLSDPFDTRCNDSIVSPTTWHHIAMVRDYGNTLKLYIDGQLKSTQTDITGIANPYTNQRDIVMGAFFDANSNAYFNFLEGSLDDICIWNRALTNQEINQLTNQNICYQTITVTDTLLINVNLTGFNPVTYQNTIKVFPNPTNDHITIDFGTNYASLNGYSIRIDNTLGQSVFTSPVQQQAAYINLSSWTGVGVYFIYLLDSQNHVVDVRKIVLQ